MRQKKKTIHQQLYIAKASARSSLIDSLVWLKLEDLSAMDEARYCYLLDRTMLYTKIIIRPTANLRSER